MRPGSSFAKAGFFGPAAGILYIAGCSTPTLGPVGEPAPALVVTVPGDWDDVAAALRAAAPSLQMAATRLRTPSPNRFEANITDSLNRPGSFTAVLLPDGSITLTAQIGRLGDDAAQSALLGRVAERLDQLRGRDTAPMSWD